MEHRALAPPALAEQVSGAGGVDALSDPFEDEGPRQVTLDRRDGNLYAAREALRAIGASWDKEQRIWTIREDKADYARAIVAAVTNTDSPITNDSDKAVRPIPADAPPAAPPRVASSPIAPAPAERPTLREKTPPKVQEAPTDAPLADTYPTSTDGRIRLGGLWQNRTRDGREYLSGRLTPTVRIVIFKNNYRTSENQPSHIMYLAPIENGSDEPE